MMRLLLLALALSGGKSSGSRKPTKKAKVAKLPKLPDASVGAGECPSAVKLNEWARANATWLVAGSTLTKTGTQALETALRLAVADYVWHDVQASRGEVPTGQRPALPWATQTVAGNVQRYAWQVPQGQSLASRNAQYGTYETRVDAWPDPCAQQINTAASGAVREVLGL